MYDNLFHIWGVNHMKKLKNIISVFVMMVLAFSVLNLQADDEDDEEEASVEEVIVTGSRIKRASNYDSTGPVEVFTAQQVLEAGKTNILYVRVLLSNNSHCWTTNITSTYTTYVFYFHLKKFKTSSIIKS